MAWAGRARTKNRTRRTGRKEGQTALSTTAQHRRLGTEKSVQDREVCPSFRATGAGFGIERGAVAGVGAGDVVVEFHGGVERAMVAVGLLEQLPMGGPGGMATNRGRFS